MKNIILITFILFTSISHAQSKVVVDENYGDRGRGFFGDIGTGYFGNPTVGNFNKSKIVPIEQQYKHKTHLEKLNKLNNQNTVVSNISNPLNLKE